MVQQILSAANISIHALRVEGDSFIISQGQKCHKFLSTPSGWRATAPWGSPRCLYLHFYPRPPGGGRLSPLFGLTIKRHFYPRPPGGGRRHCARSLAHDLPHFYPRPPGGGRRRDLSLQYRSRRDFYPRPPGGGRRRTEAEWWRRSYFYPRPPGGGRPIIG